MEDAEKTEVAKPPEEPTSSTEKPKLDIDGMITDLCELLRDPNAQMKKKVVNIMTLPQILSIGDMNQERCQRIFESLSPDVLDAIISNKNEELSCGIVANILSFCVQATSPDVYAKFKKLVPGLVALLPKQKIFLSSTLNDIAIIVTYMPFEKSEISIIFETLRQLTTYYVKQSNNLEVSSFLSVIRLVFSKLFSLISTGDNESIIDSRGWTVGILSIVRGLLKERPEKLSEKVRVGMWDVIGSVARLIGPSWFALDQSFGKLVAQLNIVEIQMILTNPTEVDAIALSRHLRILEMFICAVHDDETFAKSTYINDVLIAIGSGIKYVLKFWADAADANIELDFQVKINLFTFAVFLLARNEFEIIDKDVQKKIGPLMVEQGIAVIDETTEIQLHTEVSRMYFEFIESMSEMLTLGECVPILVAKFIAKLNASTEYNRWQLSVIEVTVSISNFRGRVDWYSQKTLDEARRILRALGEPQQNDLDEMYKIFANLPRVR
ncbi:unnamed protein product [Caenorhabditis bovis]|uniref:Uncharacterized protein n=1 Tax=Caenorhabditis bovis TaxID=2654633 RepID=A0A8S1ECQ5_9PELO|nr:unnamed protein product [Caenorhabditis bovis]